MSIDARTASDPQPGDFDADVREIDTRPFERHGGDPDARPCILSLIENDGRQSWGEASV